MDGSTRHVLKWLDQLKAEQLQRLAISLGTPCSGTKEVMKHSIRQSFPIGKSLIVPSGRGSARLRPLSLVSIDMGIRNLAYAHLKTDAGVMQRGKKRSTCYRQPRLCAWEKIVIAPAAATEQFKKQSEKQTAEKQDSGTTATRKRPLVKPESYVPSIYATYAVKLITSIIDKHQPTHILIERQRFRSGGSPIVQDWSIRVGVFEGMLYAVLKTLSEKCGIKIEIKGVDPPKVNRFWLSVAQSTAVSGKSNSNDFAPKGKAMKNFKIELVREALEGSSMARMQNICLQVDVEAMPMVNAYLSKCAKENRSLMLPPDPGDSVVELGKLDDLADSLLQGMAWIEWQNNRARVATLGDEDAPPFG